MPLLPLPALAPLPSILSSFCCLPLRRLLISLFLCPADFGRSRPNILIAASVLAFAIGFAWLGVHTPDKWDVATGLYIVGCVSLHTISERWCSFPADRVPQ